MPKGERVILACVDENDVKEIVAFCRRGGCKVESRQSVAKRGGSVFKVRRARADLGARFADGSCGDKGFVAVQLEADPAHGGAQKAGAGIVHVQGVHTAEIDGDGGGRIHDKFTRRSPDGGVNRAALEGKALVAGAVGDEAKTRSPIDFDATGFIQRNACPRGAIGHQSLANSQVYRTRLLTDGTPPNPRCAFQTSNGPRWPDIFRGPWAQNEKRRGRKQNDRRDSAELIRPPQAEKSPALFHRADVRNLLERGRQLIMPVAAEHGFQFLNFRVRLAGAVPQIIVLHNFSLLTHVPLDPWLPAALSSLSRKSCMPRQTFTPTH